MKITQFTISRGAPILLVLSVVFLLLLSCKTEASEPDPTVWTVTVDPNGGDGLNKLEYPVNDGESLGALSNIPTIYRKHISGYKTTGGANFSLSDPIKDNTSIVIQWDWNSDFTCASTSTDLIALAQSGTKDDISCAVKNNADLNQKDSLQRPVIFISIEAKKLDTVKYFIQLGADPNAVNNGGSNPLMTAAYGGALDITKYLLTLKNVNINAVDNNGMSALIHAVTGYEFVSSDPAALETIKYLASYPGVNLNFKVTGGYNNFGRSALGIAKDQLASQIHEYQAVVDYLVSVGAKE